MTDNKVISEITFAPDTVQDRSLTGTTSDLGESALRGTLRSRIRQFAACLRIEFGPEIARDPRGFKRGLVHLLKLELPPHSGRPSNENVTRADDMRKVGKGWKEIYVACLPPRADHVLRQRDQYLLRGAVRARRRRTRTKSPLGLENEVEA